MFIPALTFASSEVGGEFDKGYLVFKSADGNLELKFDGRIMMDMGFIDSKEDNPAYANTNFRRARFAIKTRMHKVWSGEFDIDYAENAPELKDMWLAYAISDNQQIKIGNHKPFFSMAEMTTSRWYTFMETPMVTDAIGSGRRIALSYSYTGPKMFAGVSLFGDKVATNNADEEKNEPFGYSTRIIYRPIANSDTSQFFHVGVNYLVQEPEAEDDGDFKVKAGVEASIYDQDFLDTGKQKDTDDVTTMGLEFAGRMGKSSFQSEYYQSTLTHTDTTADFEFSGYYLDYSFMINGAGRPYNTSDGEFGPVIPSSDKGNLEVAFRYSTLDLNDGDVTGGAATAYTIGLNWYANTNLVFRLNHVITEFDGDANDDEKEDDDDNLIIVGDDTVSVTAARMAFYF